MRVYLWWIGTGVADEEAMEHARRHLEGIYGTPVACGVRSGRPQDAYDFRRRQFSSSRLLRWLADGRPDNAERVLGVTDEDLFIPVLTYVFGEAMLGGAAAVVSTARLQPAETALGKRLANMRLAKECAHELGHTYGLVHCASVACVMSRSASVVDVDSKDGTLCRDCRTRLRELRQRSGLRP